MRLLANLCVFYTCTDLTRCLTQWLHGLDAISPTTALLIMLGAMAGSFYWAMWNTFMPTSVLDEAS